MAAQSLASPAEIGKRTANGLRDRIGRLVDIFQPHECARCSTSRVYDPDRSKTALILLAERLKHCRAPLRAIELAKYAEIDCFSACTSLWQGESVILFAERARQ